MHALALPQHGVGDLDRAIGRLLAARRPGTEIDHDRRGGRHRLALQPELRHRQRAGETAELVIHEDAADVVLLQQRLDRAPRQLALLAGNIDQVGSAVGRDHEIGLRWILSRARRCRTWGGRCRRRGRSCRWGRTAAGSTPLPDRSRGSPSAGNPSACLRRRSSPRGSSCSPWRSSRNRDRRRR